MDVDEVVVHWPKSPGVADNWGDKLNPLLVRWLSRRKVVHRSQASDPRGPCHLVIGSALVRARNRIVWGSGFSSSDREILGRPKRICAVRGPLSRAKLLEQGIECPEIYGDPALLMPLFYLPQIEPTHDLGLIQHFREIGVEPVPSAPEGLSVKIIDITGGIKEVVDAIVSCRVIVSSSLHGIVASHAYGIPAAWMKPSDLPKGDGFKFRDYWASMGRDDVKPLAIEPGKPLDLSSCISTPGEVRVDLFALLQACPFVDDLRRRRLILRAEKLASTVKPASIFRLHAGFQKVQV